MPPDNRFSVTSAFQAAADDELPLWVGEFLASRGSGNATLAAGLAQREHWWLGPLWLPLELLVPLAGADDDVLIPIDEDEWESDVSAMEESIARGMGARRRCSRSSIAAASSCRTATTATRP